MNPSANYKQKSTILIVDDDHGTVELMQMMLQVRGYHTLTAFSGLEAVALLQEQIQAYSPWQPLPIDLILLDIMMPDMDGFKVCQHVKNDPLLKYIPVIMVTALENVSDKVAAVEFGADGYITKPFLPEELGSVIKAKLQIKAREEELLRRNRELETIDAVAAAAARTLDPNHVLEGSIDVLMEYADLSAAAVYLYDQASGQLRCVTERRIKRPATLSIQDNLLGEIIHTQQPTILAPLSTNNDFQFTSTAGEPPDAWMGIPLQGVERLLGVLEVYHTNAYAFDKQELKLYTTIGQRIGGALENAQLFQHTQTLLTQSYALRQTNP